jgi:hypothetical protein
MRVILKPGGVALLLVALVALAAFALRPRGGPPAVRAAAVAPTLLHGSVGGDDGDMEHEGSTRLPTGWGNVTEEKGTLRASRDGAVAHGGAASLRLEAAGGPATGNVSHPLPVAESAGRRLVVRGWLRVEGRPETIQVAVFAQDAAYKTVLWGVVASPTADPAGAAGGAWVPFEGRAAVPPGARDVRLMLFLSGQGRVWLDDVTVAVDGIAPAP